MHAPPKRDYPIATPETLKEADGILFGYPPDSEATQLMTMAFMTSHGMTFVPLGYRAKQLFNVDELHGGSPWGAGTIAGPDNSRQVSKLEKEIAMEQGKSFAEVTKKLSA
ncbi:Flavoprotein-like domain [Phytophthora cactorum]|nr:Flavoprotein-like domain [Phytophthora cactorum]